MKTKNTIILAVASAMSLMLVASCNKAERIVVPEEEISGVTEESGITVAEAVDNLEAEVGAKLQDMALASLGLIDKPDFATLRQPFP